MYVCMYVCMYVYIYIYIYIHTHRIVEAAAGVRGRRQGGAGADGLQPDGAHAEAAPPPATKEGGSFLLFIRDFPL